uniref:Uncharacterized protein n=1 Tax=Manihot esculenta TaxID=3983 RepID=A0A2C9VIX0_MANES
MATAFSRFGFACAGFALISPLLKFLILHFYWLPLVKPFLDSSSP